MNITKVLRRIGGGSAARDAYQVQQQLAAEQLQLLCQPGGFRHRATALDATARALAFCGDLAADAMPREARRSGLGDRYGACWYQQSRACRILASAEWAPLTADRLPGGGRTIHPRDPLEGHPDVEPAFLRLCHEPDLRSRALILDRGLAPALHRHLPEAASVLAAVGTAYLQAANATTVAHGSVRPARAAAVGGVR